MKYLIISDIHGSFEYLNSVLKYNDDSIDKIIILGDVLYHGPRNDLPKEYAPKKVIPILNELKDKILCIKGNCDAEVDQMVLSFKINDELNLSLNGFKVHLEHGHHLDFDNVKKYESSIIMYGHYHIPRLEMVDGVLLCNPGSISIPKSEEGNTFIIFENNVISIRNLKNEVLKEITL